MRIDSRITANMISKLPQSRQQFTGVTEPEADYKSSISNVTPDYAVKTPMQYQKISEFSLPFNLKGSLYKLANGQRVVIVPKEGKTVLTTYVNAGSMNENDDKRGIFHFIEHNLFNGSEGLEQGGFFKKVDEMGASTNASTGFSETNYYISSNLLNKSDLETNIKLQASMLETPRFALEMLEKEKGIVNSEINMITSNPFNIGINKSLKNLYQINTTSLDMIGGTTSNITNITRADVLNYFNNNYYPANMVTVVTGEVEPEETMRLLSKYFKSTKLPPKTRHFESLIPIQSSIREDIISDKATSTFMVLSFDGPKNNETREKVAMQVLSTLLTMPKTSRIAKPLKTYNSDAVMELERMGSKPTDGRAVLIMAEGSEENSEKILKTIYSEIAKISDNPPSEEELNVVKKCILKDFSNLFERSSFANSLIGSAFQDNDIDYITKFESIVKTLTPQDISNTARKYLDLTKASVTVVHPADVTPETIQRNYNQASDTSFTGASAKKQVINMNSVKEYKLANNFSVVLQDTNSDNACLNILYRKKDYPKNIKPGTGLLLYKVFSSGTQDKNEQQYQSEFDKLAMSAYFKAGYTDINISSNFSSDDMQRGLSLIKEAIESPRFNEDTLKKMKNAVREELMLSEKSAEDKLNKELYAGIPAGYSKEEILKSLDSVTLEDLKTLYEYITKDSQASIVVTAPFSRKPELKQIVFNEISGLSQVAVKDFETANLYVSQLEAKVLTDSYSKPQAEIIQAYKFKVNKNIKDKITLQLLNTILGGNPSSRLFQDLREQQKLAYSVNSKISSIEDIGVIKLKIGTTTENLETNEISYDNLQKAITGFNKHIAKLKSEKVSDQELNNAKLNLKNLILDANETDIAKNQSLEYGLISPYGISMENQLFDIIDEITADDIYNAANYIFSGKPVYSILATENTLGANKEFLNSLI